MKRENIRRIDLLNFINGHSRANRLIEEERGKRLSQLSSEESLRDYKTLCEFWEKTLYKGTSEDLERQKISLLIKRRDLLNRAGGVKK